MKNNENGQEIQGSFGLKKETNEVHIALDKLLQVSKFFSFGIASY